jgi:hypothetical protein
LFLLTINGLTRQQFSRFTLIDFHAEFKNRRTEIDIALSGEKKTTNRIPANKSQSYKKNREHYECDEVLFFSFVLPSLVLIWENIKNCVENQQIINMCDGGKNVTKKILTSTPLWLDRNL